MDGVNYQIATPKKGCNSPTKGTAILERVKGSGSSSTLPLSRGVTVD